MAPQQETTGGVRWWWIALPSFIALVVVVFAIVITLRMQDLQDSLKKSERQSAQQVTDLARARHVLETMSAPDGIRVTLTEPKTRQPMAETVYQRDRGRLVLVANNLAPLVPGHVYQLWLLPPNNGEAVPAGTFVPDERGHASLFTPMPPGMEASGFEVTVEPLGGTMTPTTKPVLVGTTS